MKFIIPILVGAVIGYITNWLAIKMLFRPHYEKRFLGFKIPFTPGLIPKERERIAKSVGETVGKHLLTPEVLVEALCSERIGTQIKSMLEKKIMDLSESDLSITDILARVAAGKEDEIVKKAEGAIHGIILAQVQRPEVGDRIKVFIEEKIRTGFKSCKTLEFYRDLRDEVLGNLRQFAYSRELDLLMTDIINRKVGELRGDSRTLREVIPEEFIQSVRVYLYNNKDKVIQFIREEIQNPSIKEKLKAAIGGMVEENLGKLITIFISPDTIGIKILDAIEKYMYKPDSAENIAYILINSFDRIISGEVRDISPYFTPDNTAKLSLEVSNLLRGLAEKEQSIEKLILLFEERFELSQEKLWEVINYNMRNYIESLINGEELGFFIGELVHNSISDWLVKQKLSSFLGGVKPKTIEEISNAVRVLYEEFVRNKASQVAELIDIEDIVEERINSFDVAFAEEIILDVANKELKAITWLGALLGAVMGILSPLIELMTR